MEYLKLLFVFSTLGLVFLFADAFEDISCASGGSVAFHLELCPIFFTTGGFRQHGGALVDGHDGNS